VALHELIDGLRRV